MKAGPPAGRGEHGLLDGVGGVLAGNLVVRALGEADAARDPARDAWQRESHGLMWEARG